MHMQKAGFLIKRLILFFSDHWISLPDMPEPLFSMEVAKTSDKLFAIKGYKFCYDFITETWTEVVCSLTGLCYPLCYNKYLYAFPKYEQWMLKHEIEEPPEFNELGVLNTRLVKKHLVNGEDWHMVPIEIDSVPIAEKFSTNCTNVVAIGKKFYYIRTLENLQTSEDYSYQLVSGSFDNLQEVSEIGESHDISYRLNTLVALPGYPIFKCTAKKCNLSLA